MQGRYSLHIVDGDSRRRAQLARIAFDLGHHAEVYSDVRELAERSPRDGILVVHDVSDQDQARDQRKVLTQLGEAGVWLPVILADESPTTDQVVDGIKRGALDFIELPCPEERLMSALNRVAQEAQNQSAIQRKMFAARERIGTLSPREREVLEYLAYGNSNKEIARALGISPRTVEIHRANMMTKLGANHVAEAVRLRIEAKFEDSELPGAGE